MILCFNRKQKYNKKKKEMYLLSDLKFYLTFLIHSSIFVIEILRDLNMLANFTNV